MKTRNGLKYAGFGVLGVAGMILFTFVVMWLWNWLVPELFNGPVLGYWQTLGLLVLSKILFSGIGGGSHRSHSKHSKYSDDCGPMPKSRWRQKYEAKMNEKMAEKMNEKMAEKMNEKMAQNRDTGDVIIPDAE